MEDTEFNFDQLIAPFVESFAPFDADSSFFSQLLEPSPAFLDDGLVSDDFSSDFSFEDSLNSIENSDAIESDESSPFNDPPFIYDSPISQDLDFAPIGSPQEEYTIESTQLSPYPLEYQPTADYSMVFPSTSQSSSTPLQQRSIEEGFMDIGEHEIDSQLLIDEITPLLENPHYFTEKTNEPKWSLNDAVGKAYLIKKPTSNTKQKWDWDNRGSSKPTPGKNTKTFYYQHKTNPNIKRRSIEFTGDDIPDALKNSRIVHIIRFVSKKNQTRSQPKKTSRSQPKKPSRPNKKKS
eukprot:TRINITY_DN8809_c0_g1_i1.p1 TRINITY_DN8809_c0_g1~~TRINITY_DN8809_c0_g1_i1.p1  ORF type:complete len:293 (+),score=92.43 TRINITY_DN8809_c0_g1_i1:126-1004(+)